MPSIQKLVQGRTPNGQDYQLALSQPSAKKPAEPKWWIRYAQVKDWGADWSGWQTPTTEDLGTIPQCRVLQYTRFQRVPD